MSDFWTKRYGEIEASVSRSGACYLLDELGIYIQIRDLDTFAKIHQDFVDALDRYEKERKGESNHESK